MVKKVLFIDNSQYETGALRSLVFLINDLKSQYDFTVVLPENSKGRKFVEEINGIKCRELPMLEISRSLKSLKYPKVLKQNAKTIENWIEEEGFDLIHVNDIYNMLGVRLKKMGLNIPLVQHIRLLRNSYIKRFYQNFAKKVVSRADAIICVSSAILDDFPKTKKATIVHNGLGYYEVQAKKEIRSAQNLKYYCVSRLIIGKGQDDLIRAFSKVNALMPNTELHLVGDEPLKSAYGEKLIELRQDFKLENNIHFHPFSIEIEKTLKEADIFVNPSHSESFSRTCLEAQFYGIPLITTDCGGPRDVVIPNETAMMVPAKNPDKMASAMLELAQNFERRKRFSENGRKHVREKFKKENTSFKIAELYASLLA
jgi:glycosyltransferase involved in cell wall biosynthesis